MPIFKKKDDKIVLISNKLLRLSNDILRASLNEEPNKDNIQNKSIVLRNCAITLCKILMDIRKIITGVPYNISKEEIDNEILQYISITVDRLDFLFCSIYQIRIPFILPKINRYLSPVILNQLMRQAINNYEKEYDSAICLIENPVVIFENRFIEPLETKGFKDVDNYSITEFLNCFQSYFFDDDRNITLINKNIIGADSYETIVYIIPEGYVSESYGNL